MKKTSLILLMVLSSTMATAATTVAKVKVHNPDSHARSAVIIRGMLPLPASFEGNIKNLALVDGTTILPTQVNVFSTYAGTDTTHPVGRPEVVQLVARTDMPAASFKELEVVRLATPSTAASPTISGAGISGWLAAGIPAVIVESTDVFGNLYRATPLTRAHLIETRQAGPLLAEEVYQAILKPVSPGATRKPALKKFLRARVYLTRYVKEEFASVTLMIHNGSLDHPNGNVFYRDLRVGVPKALQLTVWQKPFSPAAEGHQRSTDGYTWQPCPPPSQDGKVHVMPHGSAAVLRAVVHTPTAAARARWFSNHAPVFVPVPSQELFSWSNFSTARYDAVNYPLPLHLGDEALLQAERMVQKRLSSPTLGWDLVYLREQPPGSSRTLGHAMPAGVAYGGMTGGSGINYAYGVQAAVTGHHGLMQLHVLMADRNFDRQRAHLFYDDGSQYTHGRHVIEIDGIRYLDRPYNQRGFPELEVEDAAAAVHAKHVNDEGLLSAGARRLLEYMDHDDQHLSRIFDAVPAAYLACDPLNRDRLIALGTRACRRLNIYPIRGMRNFGGWGSLFNARRHVTANPHQGVGMDRAHGWLTHALGWAHGLSMDPHIRADCIEVARVDVEVRSRAQMASGNVSIRSPSAKALKGRYFFTTGWEEGAILANGARSIVAMLSSETNAAHAKNMKRVYGRVGTWTVTRAWNTKTHAPGFFVCLREKDSKDLLETPVTEGSAAFYMGSPLTWYYELTGDTIFLERLKEMAASTDLDARAMRELGNWSYCLWLVQGGVIPGREGY